MLVVPHPDWLSKSLDHHTKPWPRWTVLRARSIFWVLTPWSAFRESAIFSGIPITQRLDPENRICGVSLIDLREGREVGLVRFEGNVQEIFAVQVLPHRFPELLEMNSELLGNTYALPDEALANVKWLPEKGIEV